MAPSSRLTAGNTNTGNCAPDSSAAAWGSDPTSTPRCSSPAFWSGDRPSSSDWKVPLPSRSGIPAPEGCSALGTGSGSSGCTSPNFTHRMRVNGYLHLTRLVRIPLDRKDRMSMAVGLEVRVPFCDHRLVEYVYNTPWWLKTYDGREKSILRAAVADLLPGSVVQRVKCPYPATSDPRYDADIQAQAKACSTAETTPCSAWSTATLWNN